MSTPSPPHSVWSCQSRSFSAACLGLTAGVVLLPSTLAAKMARVETVSRVITTSEGITTSLESRLGGRNVRKQAKINRVLQARVLSPLQLETMRVSINDRALFPGRQ